VDLDWVWDLIHLTSADKTHRLDLDGLKREVQGWFEKESLAPIMGEAGDETARIARAWLAKAGKRWRPYLAVCAAMALRGDRQEASPDLKKAAVAIECFHKASLIHDDIEDGDAQRYGSDALHVEVGMAVALNVGDFLLGDGYRLITELSIDPAIRVKMVRMAAEGHLTLSRGQGRELLWTRNPGPLSSLDVLEIFRQKTAPAFEVALRLGAFLEGADEETHVVLRNYSESLGIAYQIRDDLEDRSGGGEPSLILAIAHKRAQEGAEKELIASFFHPGSRKPSGEFQRILKERGVIEKAEDLLEAYKEEAIRSLRFLSNPTLKGLLRRVVGKIFGEQLVEGYCSEFEARNVASRAAGM
jgi:geranylgeranyl pyrophosphate synthase